MNMKMPYAVAQMRAAQHVDAYNAELQALFDRVDELRSSACMLGQVADQSEEVQRIQQALTKVAARVATAKEMCK